MEESIKDLNTTSLYLKEICSFPLLAEEEESLLINKMLSGDTSAKDKLVESNLRLVVSIAKKYANEAFPLLDLIQEGSLGLITAADKFDLTKNCKFATYATWWIKRAIYNYVNNKCDLIQLPYHQSVFNQNCKVAKNKFFQENNREATVEELATILGVSEKKVRNYEKDFITMVSIDSSIGDEENTLLLDTIPDERLTSTLDTIIDNERKREVYILLESALNEDERFVIKRYFDFDNSGRTTLDAISKDLRGREVSKQRVAAIKAKAMRKLRLAIIQEGLYSDFL